MRLNQWSQASWVSKIKTIILEKIGRKAKEIKKYAWLISARIDKFI